jgi:hypothetical protein
MVRFISEHSFLCAAASAPFLPSYALPSCTFLSYNTRSERFDFIEQ